MENASKALIIAGAILLSILIISLGIMIFNQAQDVTKGGGMSKAEISAFNSSFEKYTGSQTGSAVKSLIQEVNTSNATDKADGSDRNIVLEGTGVGTTTGGYYRSTGISSTKKYTVTIEEYDNSGYISKMKIQ